MTPQEIFERLTHKLGEAAVFDLHADPAKDRDPWFQLAPSAIEAVCQLLRTDADLAFDYLECITGVDYPAQKQIAVVYHVYSYGKHHRVVLKALLDRASPSIRTVSGIWSTANWQERECFDLLGVVFEGHPDLRRLLLPEDWQGHPLRKDYAEQEDYHGIPTVRPNPVDLLKIKLPGKDGSADKSGEAPS